MTNIHLIRSVTTGAIMTEPDESIECPMCKAKLRKEDIVTHIFPKATVLSCPVCKKTISLQPKNF